MEGLFPEGATRDEVQWMYRTVGAARGAPPLQRLAAARAVLGVAMSCPPCCEAAQQPALVAQELEMYAQKRRRLDLEHGGEGGAAGKRARWAAAYTAGGGGDAFTAEELLEAALPHLFPEHAGAAAAAAAAAAALPAPPAPARTGPAPFAPPPLGHSAPAPFAPPQPAPAAAPTAPTPFASAQAPAAPTPFSSVAPQPHAAPPRPAGRNAASGLFASGGGTPARPGLSDLPQGPSGESTRAAPAWGGAATTAARRGYTNPSRAPAHSAADERGRGHGTPPPPSRFAPRYEAGGREAPGDVQCGFVSAAQQLEADEARKGKRVGAGNGGGAQSSGRKTLGTRRFVPPFKRSEPDGGGEAGGTATKPSEDPEAKKAKEEKELAEKIPADLLLPDGTVPDRLKNVDPELLVTISNEILENSYVAWDDIAGLEHAKSAVYEAIIWPLQRPDLFEGIRGPTKGLLLFGPPGTGKTMIGKAIASESDSTFFNISASTLMSKWVGEGEKMVRALFAVASCKQPAVVFIDEIDSLLTQRSDGEQDHTRRLKTEFLVQLDGAGTAATDRILIVGATNRPQELDEAARRRMEKRLYIPLPDDAARGTLITRLLRDVPHAVHDDEVPRIVKKSKGFSGADMKVLCREAALNPLRALGQAIQSSDKDAVRPVVLKDFAVAFQCVKPTVSAKDIAEHVKFDQVYGSFSAKQTAELSAAALDNFFDD